MSTVQPRGNMFFNSGDVRIARTVRNPPRQSRVTGFADVQDLYDERRKNGVSRQLYAKRIKSGMTPREAATTPPKSPAYKKVDHWRFVTKHGDIKVVVFNVNGDYFASAIIPTEQHLNWSQAKCASSSLGEALRLLQTYLSAFELILEVVPPGQPTRKEIRSKTRKPSREKNDIFSTKKKKEKRFGDDDDEFDMSDLDDLEDIVGNEYGIELYCDNEE